MQQQQHTIQSRDYTVHLHQHTLMLQALYGFIYVLKTKRKIPSHPNTCICDLYIYSTACYMQQLISPLTCIIDAVLR